MLYSNNRYGRTDIGSGRTIGKWNVNGESLKVFNFDVEDATWKSEVGGELDIPPLLKGQTIKVRLLQDGSVMWNNDRYNKRKETEFINMQTIEKEIRLDY